MSGLISVTKPGSSRFAFEVCLRCMTWSRLCGIDVHRACRLVDGSRVVAERFGLQVNVWNFRFARAPAVPEHDSAILVEALQPIDRSCIFLVSSGKEITYRLEKTRHRRCCNFSIVS
jgi:hypothetical protein